MSPPRTLASIVAALVFMTAISAASPAVAADGAALDPAATAADAHERAVEACLVGYLRATGAPEAEQVELAARARGELAGAAAGGPALTTGMTGLVMGGLAMCDAMLDEPGSAEAAQRLCAALRATAWDDARGLSGGPTGAPATAADHARLIHGLLALYAGSGRVEALAWAVELEDRLDGGFWNDSIALYGHGAAGDPGIAALAALDLVQLARITDDDAFAARAARILSAHPPEPDGVDGFAASSLLTMAGRENTAPVLHLTLIGSADEPGTVALLRAAHRHEVPGFAIAVLDEGPVSKALRKRFPGMPLMPRAAGKQPTAYLCTAKACDPPTTDPEILAKRIAELSAR